MTHLAYYRRGAASFLTAGALALAAAAARLHRRRQDEQRRERRQHRQRRLGRQRRQRHRRPVVITGSGGGGGDVVVTGSGGMISADGGCMMDQLTYTPTTPTVFILVDRSGSEFANGCPNVTTGPYFTLKSAVESVVSELQAQFRFGLGVFVGDHATGTCTLDWDTVPIALNNSTRDQAPSTTRWARSRWRRAGTARPTRPPSRPSRWSSRSCRPTRRSSPGRSSCCSSPTGRPTSATTATRSVRRTPSPGRSRTSTTPASERWSWAIPFDTGRPSLAFNAERVAEPRQRRCRTGGRARRRGSAARLAMQVYYAVQRAGTATGADSWTSLYTAAGHAASDITTIATYGTTGGNGHGLLAEPAPTRARWSRS